MPKCKKCEEEILFVKTPEDKWMPLNVKAVTVVVLEDGDYSRQQIGHTPHWATCPAAETFRNPRQLNLVMPGVRTPRDSE